MRNSVLLTSDLKSVILVDNNQNNQSLSIGKRGVLLSVLGADICATEVPAELDNHIKGLLKDVKAFYDFEISEAGKSQLCITYNDVSNVVFIIGITDIDVGFTGPSPLPSNKVSSFAVRLKESPSVGLTSSKLVLARLETEGAVIGGKRFVRFYYLPAI